MSLLQPVTKILSGEFILIKWSVKDRDVTEFVRILADAPWVSSLGDLLRQGVIGGTLHEIPRQRYVVSRTISVVFTNSISPTILLF